MIDPKPMWNDGPPLIDFMGSEGAPPIARRHLAYGGGGGGGGSDPPDMSQYIAHMTKLGNQLFGQSTDTYNWARKVGAKLQKVAGQVSERAGQVATSALDRGERLAKNWEETYTPLYKAQAADATRMMGNLPVLEDQYAGKAAADVAQGFDAAKGAESRKLQSYGLKMPGLAASAIDATTANQRALGQVAGAEMGRLMARNEARTVTQNAIQQGTNIPQIGNQSTSTGLAAGNQQVNAPAAAINTSAAALSPSIAFANSAFPYLHEWGSTMQKSYDQQLESEKLAQSQGGSGIGAMAGTILGGVAGSFGGPLLGSIGSTVGNKIGASIMAAKGGVVPQTNYVPAAASPSGGAIKDDVPAKLQRGEFVWPEDVVAWRGEEWMQKQIAKAREDRQKYTVAEPDVVNGAIQAQAPTFVSEGARA